MFGILRVRSTLEPTEEIFHQIGAQLSTLLQIFAWLLVKYNLTMPVHLLPKRNALHTLDEQLSCGSQL